MNTEFDAYITVLAAEHGGRTKPIVDCPMYRPHIVVGDPCRRKAITDDAGVLTEHYLGVHFSGDGRPLGPGPAHHVALVPMYSPRVNYDAIVPGATFTIREGGSIVGFGVVAPPGIYADFNGADVSAREPALEVIHLHRWGSLQHLSRLGLVLSEGMRLTVYMDSDEAEDIEADAEVYFDSATGFWLAEYDPARIRDVPRHSDWIGAAFPCVSCRSDVAPHIQIGQWDPEQLCPRCKNPIQLPILPPR